MPDEYRWMVRVKGRYRADYARVVNTDGPYPHEAVKTALDMISSGDNDLWQQNDLTINVERVR